MLEVAQKLLLAVMPTKYGKMCLKYPYIVVIFIKMKIFAKIFGNLNKNYYLCVNKLKLTDMAKLDNLQDLGDVLEPFDPEYLSNKPYEIPQISAYEKRFLHKVSIIEKKLRRHCIDFEWLAYKECFRIPKYIGDSEYPTYRYVYVNMEENDYSFGTEKEDLVFDSRASVVIDAVVKWVNK